MCVSKRRNRDGRAVQRVPPPSSTSPLTSLFSLSDSAVSVGLALKGPSAGILTMRGILARRISAARSSPPRREQADQAESTAADLPLELPLDRRESD